MFMEGGRGCVCVDQMCYRENGVILQDSKNNKLYCLFNLFLPAVQKHAGMKKREDCVWILVHEYLVR
jgi:hypothetical protein